MKTRLTACVLIAAVAAGAADASRAATTLRMSHFWPAASQINQNIFEPWAEAVEQASGGELRVQNYPSQTLSKADDAYDSVVNGIADIAITAQGYTAGRFPLSQIVELPGIATSAPQGACVLQTLYDQGEIADEYQDTHVLFLFTTGPGYIHTQDTAVKTPRDLRGLRIRRPTAVVGDMLEDMGAKPVGMPAPDIYTSLQRGVIDGVSLPWEGMETFRLNELAHYHTQVPFYTLIFVATMSQRTYDRLTPEQQRAIDDNGGMQWAETAGRVFAQMDAKGEQAARDAGDTIVVVDDPLQDPQWKEPLDAGIQHYLDGLEARGLTQARDVYSAAQAASQRCATSS